MRSVEWRLILEFRAHLQSFSCLLLRALCIIHQGGIIKFLNICTQSDTSEQLCNWWIKIRRELNGRFVNTRGVPFVYLEWWKFTVCADKRQQRLQRYHDLPNRAWKSELLNILMTCSTAWRSCWSWGLESRPWYSSSSWSARWASVNKATDEFNSIFSTWVTS